MTDEYIGCHIRGEENVDAVEEAMMKLQDEEDNPRMGVQTFVVKLSKKYLDNEI